MSQPVCQLEDFYLTNFQVKWHDPGETQTIDLKFGFDYDVARHAQDLRRYRLRFRVNAKPETAEPVGYEVESEIVGFFSFPEGALEDQMEMLIRVNGCTILYGILRGQLANITGSFPGSKLVLPTFMMKDVVTDIEKKRFARGAIEPTESNGSPKKSKSKSRPTRRKP